MVFVPRHHRRIPVDVCPTLPTRGVSKEGIEFYTLTMDELQDKYGFSERRRQLLKNLKEYLVLMKEVGIVVKGISVYGSFISRKMKPNDIDVAIWREQHPGDLMKRTGELLWLQYEAKGRHIDTFSVISQTLYCNWLSKSRQRGSKKVVQLSRW